MSKVLCEALGQGLFLKFTLFYWGEIGSNHVTMYSMVVSIGKKIKIRREDKEGLFCVCKNKDKKEL